MVDPNGLYVRRSDGLYTGLHRLGGAVSYADAPSAMPTTDMINGSRRYALNFSEDFNTDVAIGGFVPKQTDPSSGLLQPVGGVPNPYASKLMVYPTGFGAGSTGKSRPEQILSVSNSCLTYNFMVNAAGENACATVHFLIGSAIYNGSYQGYYIDPTIGGRFMFRHQVHNAPYLRGFGAVSQLIANGADWSLMHGEMDMDEGSLFGYAPGGRQTNWHPYQATNAVPGGPSANLDWGNDVPHNTTYDWIPVGDPLEPAGRETVWIDGVKVFESLGDRIAQNFRAFFAFQTGANAPGDSPPAAGAVSGAVTMPANGVVRGQLLVDWVAYFIPTTV